jgi:RHS repeat-associated protein
VLNLNQELPDVLAETDASGTVTNYYTYGNGLISKINAASGQEQWYHFDPTGNTLALTDSSQNVTDTYAYTPYGEVTSQGTSWNPFKYSGKHGVMDDGNGTNYMRARYYMPFAGRFMSLDAVWGAMNQPQSLNRYAYVQGDPLGRIDPSGMDSTKDKTKNLKDVLNDYITIASNFNLFQEIKYKTEWVSKKIITKNVTVYKNNKKNIPKKYKSQPKKIVQAKSKTVYKQNKKVTSTGTSKFGKFISLIPSILDGIDEYSETKNFEKSFGKLINSAVSGIADPLGYFEELTGSSLVDILSGNSDVDKEELIKQLNQISRTEV